VQQEVDEANEELEDLRAQVDEKDKRIASMATELSRLSNAALLVRIVVG
jgi:predicted nuclease with TOPRIM domain